MTNSNKYFNPDMGVAISDALKEGLQVIQSTPLTLLLDIDTISQGLQFEHMYIPFLEAYEPNGEMEEWTSKGGNKHKILHMKIPLFVTHRIALETILGSDPQRSLFALARVKEGVEEPGLLFKPAAEPVKVVIDKDGSISRLTESP